MPASFFAQRFRSPLPHGDKSLLELQAPRR
jgi:hypothetical protein